MELPPTARVETWVGRGIEVSPFYDPMLAKIIVHAADREQAITNLISALDATALHGIETNVDYLKQVLHSTVFRNGWHTTSFLNYSHFYPGAAGQGVARPQGTPAFRPQGQGGTSAAPRGGTTPRR